MQTALRKMGNSTGMILPRAILQEVGVCVGTTMDVRVEEGRVIVTPLRKPREGWAEDAERVAAHGVTEEEAKWIGVGNDADEDWT